MRFNADKPAFPCPDTTCDECTGLTKREYFAAVAMNGMMASLHGYDVPKLVADSLRAADQMLAALEKPAGENKSLTRKWD